MHFRDDADVVFACKQRPADVEFEHEMRRGGEIEFKLRCAAFIAYEFVFVSVQDKDSPLAKSFSEAEARSGQRLAASEKERFIGLTTRCLTALSLRNEIVLSRPRVKKEPSSPNT